MWHYLTFLPCGIALVAQVVLFIGTARRMPTRHPWKVATALWLAAWLTVVLFLYASSDAPLSRDFALQRDGGYWLGSAVMLSLPFLAVAALRSFMFAPPRATPTTAFAGLASVALAGWLLSPGLFSFGWVAGCVVAGSTSCM